MKRIGGANSARWLADSLQQFDWIGTATRGVASENRPIRFKSSRFDPRRAASSKKPRTFLRAMQKPRLALT
jgi:hypothetical protein